MDPRVKALLLAFRLINSTISHDVTKEKPLYVPQNNPADMLFAQVIKPAQALEVQAYKRKEFASMPQKQSRYNHKQVRGKGNIMQPAHRSGYGKKKR
jgi:hypothetical protein